MEKIMTVEERIRRAEEIYNNRINNRTNSTFTYDLKNKTNNKKIFKVKKMVLQIIVCSLLYLTFYMISSKEYIISNDFKNGLNSLINTQMDFNKLYNDGKNFFPYLFSTNNEINVENIEEKENNYDNSGGKNDDIKNEILENSESKDANDLAIEVNTSHTEDVNIGGADIQSEELEDIQNEEKIDNKEKGSYELEKTQMEMDAEDIKNSISFEKPIDGYISSTFGLRNPTTSSVPKNHTGIDIAATAGTVIKSATDGTIVLASSYGDFGNHYKIQIEDVIIIYAHCKRLYLKEGDKVTKGQEIAEVGSTGNSTGPHLHFEIRKDGRLVDPQLILDI